MLPDAAPPRVSIQSVPSARGLVLGGLRFGLFWLFVFLLNLPFKIRVNTNEVHEMIVHPVECENNLCLEGVAVVGVHVVHSVKRSVVFYHFYA